MGTSSQFTASLRLRRLPAFFEMNSSTDPRRPDKVIRYSAILSANSVQNAQNANPGGQQQAPINDDLIPDYMNILGMIFSMCALMLRLKWAAWVAIYCSCISFANTKLNDDTKQIMSSFMLSISAVVMSYLQNPAPMTLPGST